MAISRELKAEDREEEGQEPAPLYLPISPYPVIEAVIYYIVESYSVTPVLNMAISRKWLSSLLTHFPLATSII